MDISKNYNVQCKKYANVDLLQKVKQVPIIYVENVYVFLAYSPVTIFKELQCKNINVSNHLAGKIFYTKSEGLYGYCERTENVYGIVLIFVEMKCITSIRNVYFTNKTLLMEPK